MKKIKLLLFVFSILFSKEVLYAQGLCNVNTKTKVSRYIESNQSNRQFTSIVNQSIAPVKDGFWVTGLAKSVKSYQDELYIAKFNDTGKILFFKHYGNNGNESGYPIPSAPMSDGGVVVSARSDNDNVNASLANVSRFDALGNLKWSKSTPTFNNSGALDQFRDVYVDSATQEIYLTGTATQRLGTSSAEILLAKLDSGGNTKILKYITVTADGSFLGCHGLRILPTKYLAKKIADFVILFWGGSGSEMRSGVLFIKSDGTLVKSWVGEYTGGIVQVSDAIFKKNGELILMGYANNNGGGVDVLLMCLDPITAKLKWRYTYGTSASDYGGSIFFENNKLFVTSTSKGIAGGNNKRVLLEIDTLGNKKNEWSMVNPNNAGESYETLNASQDDVAVLSNKSTVYTGYANSFSPNITLIFASPCSGLDCFLKKSDFLKQKTFNYNDASASFNETIETKLIPLNNISVVELSFTQELVCKSFKCKAPIRVLKSLDSFCLGSSYQVNLQKDTAATFPISYLWNDGDTSTIKKFLNAGTYTVKIENSCGVVYDTISLNVINKPTPFIIRDTILCNRIFSYQINLTKQNVNIRWSDGDVNFIKTITNFGSYFVDVSNSCGGFSDSFSIRLDSVPSSRLPSFIEVCEGGYELVNLPINKNWNYKWIKGPNQVSNKFTVNSRDTLILEIISKCGITYDTVIGKEIFCKPCEIFMPNAFTPFNNDNLNLTIKPVSNCEILNGTWSVYNRWGQAIFERIPIDQAWDATYMGEPVIPGVYAFIVYVIYQRQGAGVFQISGNITVLE